MAAQNYNGRKGFYFDEAKGRFRVALSFVSNGKQIRRSKLLPKSITAEEAAALADSMRASLMLEGTGISPAMRWEAEVQRAYETPGSWLREMAIRAKQRAKQKGLSCALALDDLRRMCLATRGRCEVSGVAFSHVTVGRGRMRPFIPSVDRRVPALGYTPTNCRIVCACINVAMFSWGEETFKRVAVGYVVNQFFAGYTDLVRQLIPATDTRFLPTDSDAHLKNDVSH